MTHSRSLFPNVANRLETNTQYTHIVTLGGDCANFFCFGWLLCVCGAYLFWHACGRACGRAGVHALAATHCRRTVQDGGNGNDGGGGGGGRKEQFLECRYEWRQAVAKAGKIEEG